MNKKQRKTYDAIFAEPIRRNINNISLNIHSPHPQIVKNTRKNLI